MGSPETRETKQDADEAYLPRLDRLALEAYHTGDFVKEGALWAEKAGAWAVVNQRMPSPVNAAKALVAYQFARDIRANHGLSQNGLEVAFKKGVDTVNQLVPNSSGDINILPPTETVYIPGSRVTPRLLGEQDDQEYISGATAEYNAGRNVVRDSDRPVVVGGPPQNNFQLPEFTRGNQGTVNLDHPDDTGRALERDSDGNLTIRTPGGLVRDASGDLSFRRSPTIGPSSGSSIPGIVTGPASYIQKR